MGLRILLYSAHEVLAMGAAAVVERAGHSLSVCEDLGVLTGFAYANDIALIHLITPSDEINLPVMEEISKSIKTILWANTAPKMAVQLLERGVSGIIPTAISSRELIECLNTVGQGGQWYAKEAKSAPARKVVALTRRQGQLAMLLSQEHPMSNQQIAAAFFITEGTVKVELRRLFKKVGVKNRGALGVLVRANGYLWDGSPVKEIPTIPFLLLGDKNA